MDELTIVKDFYPEAVPPAPEAVERAYVRMMRRPRHPARWWAWPQAYRLRTAGYAATAGLAAVALILALVTGLGARRNGRTPPPSIPTARAVLLDAARHVTASATTGRYWLVRIRDYQVLPGGTAAHPYNLLRTITHDLWYARDAGLPDWDIGQDLGVMPLSAADVRAWRAAGSPRLWRINPGDAPNAFLTMTASPRTHVSQAGHGWVGLIEGDRPGLTAAQFLAVPSGVRGLRAYLEHVAGQLPSVRHPQDGGATRDQLVWSEAIFLLNDPVTAKVRAAAFRVLAGLPGVHVLGRTRDPFGHLTYELLAGSPDDGEVVFIDPLHGRLTARTYVLPPIQSKRVHLGYGCADANPATLGLPGTRQWLQPRYLPSATCPTPPKPRYGPPYHGLMNDMEYYVSSGWTNASPPVPSPAAKP